MNMQTIDNPKYVFVCGLGRSGTSVLGRNVARLENCTGFKNTGVLEDEGQFLQDVYPNDLVYGGAASFGFDPRAHLTEASHLVTPANALKLRRRCRADCRSCRVPQRPRARPPRRARSTFRSRTSGRCIAR